MRGRRKSPSFRSHNERTHARTISSRSLNHPTPRSRRIPRPTMRRPSSSTTRIIHHSSQDQAAPRVALPRSEPQPLRGRSPRSAQPRRRPEITQQSVAPAVASSTPRRRPRVQPLQRRVLVPHQDRIVGRPLREAIQARAWLATHSTFTSDVTVITHVYGATTASRRSRSSSRQGICASQRAHEAAQSTSPAPHGSICFGLSLP